MDYNLQLTGTAVGFCFENCTDQRNQTHRETPQKISRNRAKLLMAEWIVRPSILVKLPRFSVRLSPPLSASNFTTPGSCSGTLHMTKPNLSEGRSLLPTLLPSAFELQDLSKKAGLPNAMTAARRTSSDTSETEMWSSLRMAAF